MTLIILGKVPDLTTYNFLGAYKNEDEAIGAGIREAYAVYEKSSRSEELSIQSATTQEIEMGYMQEVMNQCT